MYIYYDTFIILLYLSFIQQAVNTIDNVKFMDKTWGGI